MSHEPAPGEWQGNPAERQGTSWQQPSPEGQAWPAGAAGQDPGQQVPPGEAQPGYGVPAYGVPAYGGPGYGAGPYGKPPSTHVVWARIAAACGVLFSTILGLPAGLIAMSYARKVRQHWESGDQQAAFAASKNARIWAIVSTALDVLGVILLVIVILAQVASSTSNFRNPAVVAASIKTQLQHRISDPSSAFYSPGLKVTSVVCTPIRANADHCVDHFSNGQTASETAVISANGDHYLTH